MKKIILEKFSQFILPKQRSFFIKGGYGEGGGGAGTCGCLPNTNDTKVDCGSGGGSINCKTSGGQTYTLNCQAPATCT